MSEPENNVAAIVLKGSGSASFTVCGFSMVTPSSPAAVNRRLAESSGMSSAFGSAGERTRPIVTEATAESSDNIFIWIPDRESNPNA